MADPTQSDDYNPTQGDVRPVLRDANDLKYIPLFANSLDASDPNNHAAQAMQALIEEENPVDRATNLKNSGNKAYQLGPDRWEDAVIYYSQALDIKCGDNSVDAVIYANRAQVQLKRGQYGKCIKDCKACLALNPEFVKAYFRAGTACLKLKKFQEAQEFCTTGLELDSNNAQLHKLQENVTKFWELQKKVEAEKAEKARREAEAKAELEAEIQRRNLGLTWTVDRFSAKAYKPERHIWFEDNLCVFPVMFLYPEFAQSDFVASFKENHRFIDHLIAMFGESAPWDPDHTYKPHTLSMYFLNKNDELIEVKSKKMLKHVVFRKDYDIPYIPVFYVLLGGSEFERTFRNSYTAEVS